MKYVCLGYMDEKTWDAIGPVERAAFIEECIAYDRMLLESGHRVGGELLQRVCNATTLRWENGDVSVSDGPYAQTKEQLGGILVLEAKDLNQAIQLVSLHPNTRLGGTFEVRPAEAEPPCDAVTQD